MPISKSPLKRAFGVYQLTDPKEFEQVHWLWYPYIPAGNATMIFGPGGVGKSSLCCNIAAHISTGTALPGQRMALPPQKVLILSAEDDVKAVLGPKTYTAGANMENIYFGDANFIIDEASIRDLRHYLHEYALGVVFIDPIVSFMGGKRDMNKMNEVRSFTGALQDVAKQTGTAIITVHHSRKSQEGYGYDMSAGSADFINGVRSAIYAHQGNAGETVFEHVKANLGPKGRAIEYQMLDGGQVEWGEFVDFSSVAAPIGRPNTERADAVVFLRAALAAGPMPSAELDALAADEGIAKRTLDRAKKGTTRATARRVNGTLTWFTQLLDYKDTSTDETDIPRVDPRIDGEGETGLPRPSGVPVDAGTGASAGGNGHPVDGGRSTGDSGESNGQRPSQAQELEQWFKEQGIL